MSFFVVSLAFCLYVMSGSVACDPPKSEPTVEKTTETPKESGEQSVTPEGEPAKEVVAETTPDGAEPVQEKVPDTSEPPEMVQPEPNPNVGKIKWSVSTSGEVNSIALSPDEKTVYVGANALTAYKADDGSEVWSLNSLGGKVSAPVVGTDGKIYVGSDDKKLYAINPDGKRVAWSVTLNDVANHYPPALSKDGSIVYVVAGNALHAYKTDSAGEKAWAVNFVLTAGIVSGPSVASDGTVYVCGKDKTLQAIKPDGTKFWEKSVGTNDTDLCQAPAIDADGTLYVGGGALHAFAPNGDIKWVQTSFGAVTTSVVIHQSFLYFGTFTAKLFKVNKSDGKAANILWENGVTLSVTGEQYSSPTVGAGGIIYIGSGGSRPSFKFISPSDGKGIQTISASRNEFIGAPAIAKDGTLYIGNTDGVVFAIWTDSLGLANSPWPRATHDNQNRGHFK